MPPKRRIAKMQKRKHLGQTGNSTNNLNNQSKSTWKCRRSTRLLIQKPTKISDRRRSLRSARKLIDTGTTSLSRCKQPQNSSGHSSASSAPDDIQQHDVPADTINSAYKVLEGSDLVESPSKYLVQVAYPLTLEQKVENPTMGISEMVEEEDEAEKSLSNHSNQMDGHSMFEEESVPLEQEPLAGGTQASSKINRNSISRSGCSSPSFSLKLTEMVDILGKDNDEVVDSYMPKDTIGGYQVKQELMPLLRKIIHKHGDIARNCAPLSMKYRSKLLEMVCEVISELEKKDVTIDEEILLSKIELVKEIKAMEVEVEWLQVRLTEVLDARKILQQIGMLKEKIEKSRNDVESAENELEECEARKKEVSQKLKEICEKETAWIEKLARVKDESTRISRTVRYAKSKVNRFLNCSLMDDLL